HSPVRVAHRVCEPRSPDVFPHQETCGAVGGKALSHKLDILCIQDIVHLSFHLIEEHRLATAELLGLKPLDVSTSILLDHNQVDDANRTACDQILECREDFAAKLVAGELDDDVLDGTDTHVRLPRWLA